MCGIIGYVGTRAAAPILLEGLRHLEYRGYDSAGIAVMESNGSIAVRKSAGKLNSLALLVDENAPLGAIGLGHTRWATHGRPNDINAHPHVDCSGGIVVVHNGIVENYLELRKELIEQGHRFLSDTDTEVIPHLIEKHLESSGDLVAAVRQTIKQLGGAHAMVVMAKREPRRLVAARVGNAGGVLIGVAEGEKIVASDIAAVLPYTRKAVFLADGEVAAVGIDELTFVSAEGKTLEKQPLVLPYDPLSAAKGSYKHFMLKEMMEQPESILDTIRGRLNFDVGSLEQEGLPFTRAQLQGISRVILLGMGTSLHAAIAGRHYIERIAGIPAEYDNASEFRYRQPILGPETLLVSVSQSGETVDTLAAMGEAKRQGALQVAICNVPGSQATQLADGVVYTRCGLEIGVCSTKTFTASLVALYMLACYLGHIRGSINEAQTRALLEPLARLPYLAGEVTKGGQRFEHLAHQFSRYSHFLYLARGLQYPIALEGALKLKEVSYIHAEGYPAGEMKHGPIALVDSDMPVVAIAVRDEMYEKMMSNIEQIKAREGTIIAIGTEGDTELAEKADHVLYVPDCEPLLAPVLTALPLQFLAYHIAVRRGCDVDQPRNLAKTVTVE